MNKRNIIIHLDTAAEAAIIPADLFRSVSRLDADRIIVVGTPSQDMEQNITSLRSSGFAVDVKPVMTENETEQLRANKNLIELVCRP